MPTLNCATTRTADSGAAGPTKTEWSRRPAGNNWELLLLIVGTNQEYGFLPVMVMTRLLSHRMKAPVYTLTILVFHTIGNPSLNVLKVIFSLNAAFINPVKMCISKA